jgi:hypothetical protein
VLTNLDEALLHQAPVPFSVSVTSDHRFNDRCWVSAYDPGGLAALNFGLGVYKNMNTLDGFLCCVRGTQQRNVRVSRSLDGEWDDLAAGPLRYEVVKPYQHIRVTVEPTGGLGCALDWRGVISPFIEDPTVTVINGRTATHVQRYDQVGIVDGWVLFGGEHIDVNSWFGARDHSWGVRGGVGGFEPANGATPFDGGFLVTWLVFATESWTGYVQHNRDGRGNVTFTDGVLRARDGGADRRLRVNAQDIQFPAGSRCYERATIELVDSDGRPHDIECRRLTEPIVMRGAGYDGGYADGRGLGVHRGDLVEHDTYDLSAEGRPILVESGEPVLGGQREQPVVVTLDEESGIGDFTVLAVGALTFLGEDEGADA